MNFKYVKLSSIADVSSGQGAPQGKSSYGSEGVPFIKAGNLEDLLSTKNEYDSCQLVSSEIAQKYRLKIYPSNTIVFAKSGMSAMKGRVYCLNNDSYVVNHLATIIPKTDKVIPRYLKYFFQVFSPSSLVKDRAYPSIRLEDINQVNVSLPPMNEQQNIVDVLDQADVIRQKRKQAISLLDEYLKSVFLEMFGDPVQNPKGWEVKKLEELLKFMTSGSRGWAKYYSDEGSIFLTIKNVSRNGKFLMDDITYVNPPENAESKRTKVEDKDILLSITADLGRTAVVQNLPLAAYINQHLVILRLKSEFNPYFISGFLRSPGGQIQMQRLNKGAAKAGLNFNDIKSLQILIPPKNLQDKYEEIISSVENLKNKMGEQSNELDKHFNALMQKSFGIN